MPLPILDKPTFKVKIPSSKKEIKIRAFTVKEEKILLIAQASKEADDMIDAIKQIVTNCIVTNSVGFDVDKAPLYDIEYLFIKLRAISVSNIVEITLKDAEDDMVYDFDVDLNKVEIYFDPDHSPKIQLTDDTGIMMRYPSYQTMSVIRDKINLIAQQAKNESEEDLLSSEDALNSLFEIFAASIEKVWNGDSIYVVGTDFSHEEAVSFLDQLSTTHFVKVQNFFETIPTLKHSFKYKNSRGTEREIKLEGLSSFFT